MDTTAPIATITITTAMFTAGTTGANGEPWASDREVRNPRDLQLIAWPQLDFPLRPVALYLEINEIPTAVLEWEPAVVVARGRGGTQFSTGTPWR